MSKFSSEMQILIILHAGRNESLYGTVHARASSVSLPVGVSMYLYTMYFSVMVWVVYKEGGATRRTHTRPFKGSQEVPIFSSKKTLTA